MKRLDALTTDHRAQAVRDQRVTDKSSENLPFHRSDLQSVVWNPVERGQPIRTSDLYAPGERPPLEVTPGMRAISVSLSDGTALVDGLIEAGNYVDVHFTPSGNYSNRGGMVMTLFKGVKLLAINRSQTGSSSVDRGENSVTMELTPEQTNIMLLARDRGNINLTYTPSGLGNGGVAVADENRAFLDEVLGLTPPEKPKPPFQTEIFDGGSRRVNTFDLDGYIGEEFIAKIDNWTDKEGEVRDNLSKILRPAND